MKKRLSADERHRRQARRGYAEIISDYEQEKKHRARHIGKLAADLNSANKALRGA